MEKVKTASCEILDEERIDYREHFALKEELSRTDVSEDGALKHARQQVENGKLGFSECFDFCVVRVARVGGKELGSKYKSMSKSSILLIQLLHLLPGFHIRSHGRGPIIDARELFR